MCVWEGRRGGGGVEQLGLEDEHLPAHHTMMELSMPAVAGESSAPAGKRGIMRKDAAVRREMQRSSAVE